MLAPSPSTHRDDITHVLLQKISALKMRVSKHKVDERVEATQLKERQSEQFGASVSETVIEFTKHVEVFIEPHLAAAVWI